MTYWFSGKDGAARHAGGMDWPVSRAVSPTRRSPGRFLLLFALFAAWPVGVLRAQVSVWTYHNDNARTGQNTNETVLTPANVNTNTFGKLFSCPVDGSVYAQPLYLYGVALPGKGVHNILYIATENDSVYAFDADNAGLPLWQTSFLNPGAGVGTVPWALVNDGSVFPEEGITSTPVIDQSRGVLYAMATTLENGVICFRLHALNVTNGIEITNVLIQASFPGDGFGVDGDGNILFYASLQNQRCGLALVNGSVYAAFASHGDQGFYHGWVLGYDAGTFAQTGVYNDTPQDAQGGIWMGGGAPAADAAGNLYLTSGTGDVILNGATLNGNDLGDSFIRFATTNGLNVVDYFTPSNWYSLYVNDSDLGSSGVIALPDEAGSAAHPHLVVGCGKEGTIFLVDRDNMGHLNTNSNDQIVQSLPGVISGVYGCPAYFNGRIYYHGEYNPLSAFPIADGKLALAPDSQSTLISGYPGGVPAVSADGAANGIIWEIQSDGWQGPTPAILHAYDPDNLSREFYNSSQTGARDRGPGAVKFTVPTIANGKVYVAGAYFVAVYGLASWTAPPVVAPGGGFFTNSVTVKLSSDTPGAKIHYTLDNTTPSTNSPLYVGPMVLTNLQGVTVQAEAFAAGDVPSPVVSAYFYNAASLQPAPVAADFTGAAWSGNTAQGLGPADVAGLVPQSNWNNLPGYDGGPVPLLDTAGRPSPVTIAWNSNDPRGTGSGTNSGGPSLFSGFIASLIPGAATVTLANVPAQSYRLLVYTVCDRSGAAGHYILNNDPSTTVDLAPESPLFSGEFQRGSGADPANPQPGNYIEFDNVQPVNGVITLQAFSDVYLAPVNGIQLLPPGLQPVVALNAPRNGAAFAAGSPAGILLHATAQGLSGVVTNLSFYSGGNLLTNLTRDPYVFFWSNAPPGQYVLSAQAADDSGSVGVSGEVQVAIQAGCQMDAPVITGGKLTLGFDSAPGVSPPFLLLQAPSFRGPWMTNTTAVLASGFPAGHYSFTIPVPGVNEFYRVRSP